jgi:GT2 family glycosyltransferase
MKKIAILVPVHNKLEFTKQCISWLGDALKIAENERFSYKLIIIDDGSTDGSGDWIRSHHKEITVLEGDGNLWWSGAINAGTRFAFGNQAFDYVLLWNNDIKPGVTYFRILSELISHESTDTIIGSKIMDINTGHLWSMGGIFDPRSGKKYMLGYKVANSDLYDQITIADWLPGMGTLIHRSVIDKVGYWDNVNFPQYHGDSDFTYRAKLKGFRLKVFPELILYNDTSSSGINHEYQLRGMINALNDVRSKLNLQKNLLFYKKYSVSPFAYKHLIITYFKVFGGFVKWKFLSFFGISKRP